MKLKQLMIRAFWRTVYRPYARFSRGMTLGARVVVIDGENRILLVKPTYSRNWILPGGGVERGETVLDAGIKELREEAGIKPMGEMKFFGFYSNHSTFSGDHLACFVLREFEQQPWQPDNEIAEARFFARHDLPEQIDRGSLRRIKEVFDGASISPYWAEP